MINGDELRKAIDEDIQMWENELDTFGIHASVTRYESHLAKAPDGSPSKEVLSDYVHTLKIAEKRNSKYAQ
ncbi:MAG: hypothetical protein CTY35_00140 [Methylotenera sp.]|uniref:hypothetical protein n=1 Tax=Methylotenera sp. TaxID=2051956 RepID=UPI000D4CFED8|nr:hypothetical protein [Methylotenera sp.]PPC84765.1 MAG: hypothetical protein CTY38_00140 [Methylotenera sp.]PPD02124.1 MAG: hypothetical protein CTY35_00140 [Methylotenera sp.]